VLTAFLGYLLFIVGLLFDLGRPWYIWHQLIYMNPHSVMFEVGMCVMAYTTVLFFEFLPNVFERFNLKTPIKWIKKIYPVLIVLGILLSTLHQSSLGSSVSDHAEQAASVLVHAGAALLLLRIGGCGGIGDDHLRIDAEREGLRPSPRASRSGQLGGALLVALWVNALLRFEDYFHRGMLGQIIKPSYEAYFLWLELALTFVIPITMLSFKKVRLSPQWLVSGLHLHGAGIHHQPPQYRSHRL
jgi:hypothetical protein